MKRATKRLGTESMGQAARWGILLTAALLAWPVTAQQPAGRGQDVLRLRRVEATLVRAPQYEITGGARSSRQEQWLQVQTEFASRPEWIDTLTFTYYVLLEDGELEEGESSRLKLFSGSVTYVDVAATMDGKSAVYLHPSTLARHGQLKAVAVVVSVPGRELAVAMNPETQTRWWTEMPAREGLVFSRGRSPFALVNIDDYPMEQPTGR